MAMQCFFYNLLSITLSIISKTDMDISTLVNEHQFMRLLTFNEMRTFVYDVYMRICNSMMYKRNGSCIRMKEKIIDFLDKNYTDEPNNG